MRFTLILLAFLALCSPVWAQAAKPAQSQSLPKATVNQVYNQCRVTPINRFTPGALESYCACTAAALQGNFRASEFNELQKESNQRVGNKIFESYVTNVIAPCLADPIDEIEYYYCVVDRTNDPRIANIPKFCTCMSKRLAKHVTNFGASNIMLSLGTSGQTMRPIDALWISRDFANARINARNACLSGGR